MSKLSDTENGVDAAPVTRPSAIKRFLPLGVLALGLVAFFAAGGRDYISLEALSGHYMALSDFVGQHIWLAGVIYLMAYAATTAFSLPIASVLTIAGGVLFGVVLGTVLTVLGATLGAIGIFIAAKTAFADLLREKAGAIGNKLIEGFRKDAFNYMLFLRLVPLFPFWLVNIVPAFAGVSLRAYALATLLGIIPGTAVYVSVGNGFAEVLRRGDDISTEAFGDPAIWGPLLGLALLSLVPILYKKFRKTPAADAQE